MNKDSDTDPGEFSEPVSVPTAEEFEKGLKFIPKNRPVTLINPTQSESKAESDENSFYVHEDVVENSEFREF